MKAHILEAHMTHTHRRGALRAAFAHGAKVKIISEHAYLPPAVLRTAGANANDRLRAGFSHVVVLFNDTARARPMLNMVYENPAYDGCTTAQFITTNWMHGEGGPVGGDALTRKDILRHVELAQKKGLRYVAVIEQFSALKGRVVFAQHVVMAQDANDIVRAVREKSLREDMPRATLYALVDVPAGAWKKQLNLSPAVQSQRNLPPDAFAAYRALLDTRQQMDVARAAKGQNMFAKMFGR